MAQGILSICSRASMCPVQVCSRQKHLPQGDHGLQITSVEVQRGSQLPGSFLKQLQCPLGILLTPGARVSMLDVVIAGSMDC